ncbi:hypothetical protein [Nocardia nova]|uniref:hypothetical protein n=1 Tax=Nocardia nova TaxID=37330 RepID=UPI00340013C2
MDLTTVNSLVDGNPSLLRRLETKRVDEAGLRIQAARKHLAAAAELSRLNPNNSFNLIYDAAREVVEGALLTVGIRGRGCTDELLGVAVTTIFGDDFRDFDWIRRRRKENRYSSSMTRSVVHPEELNDARSSTLTMCSHLQALIDVEPAIDLSISGRNVP